MLVVEKIKTSVRNYRHMFRNDEDERAKKMGEDARAIADWMSQSYHAKFITWLDAEASKPMDIRAQQLDMVQSAVRANTFKEIRQHLAKLHKNAMAAVRRMEGENDGRG